MYNFENQNIENDCKKKVASKTINNFFSSRGRKRMGMTFGKRETKKRITEERNYEKIFINRITIFLPFGLLPYPSQKLMMVKVLNTLNNKSNALIESPTGSGKTLALLASVCAWLMKYKEERAERRAQCPRHGTIKTDFSSINLASTKLEIVKNLEEVDVNYNSEISCYGDESNSAMMLAENKIDDEISIVEEKFVNKSAFDELNAEFQDDFKPLTSILNNTENLDSVSNLNWPENDEETNSCAGVFLSKANCNCLPRIIIYYGTRTHKQIAQVIKEYSRLPFGVEGSLRHTILASRDHGCVNPIARKKPDIKAHCKELLSHEGIGCTYRNDLRKFDNNAHRLRSFVEENGGNRVWDMEDLLKTLSETRPSVCPYFAVTRTFTIDADLVFCPFNYLIDPIIRRSSDVHLKNSIVILDEAHNVEDICREAASFELKERELIFSIENLMEKEKILLKKIHELTDISVKKTCGKEILQRYQLDNFDQGELSLDELTNALTEFHQSLEILLKFGRQLYNWLKSLALETMAKFPLRQDGSYNFTFNWMQLLESLKNDKNPSQCLLLDNCAFKELKTAWLCVVGKEKSVLDDKKKSRGNVDAARDQALNFFRPSQAAYVVFEKFITFLQFYSVKKNQEFYKANILIERSNVINTLISESTQNPRRNKSLGIGTQRQTQHSDNVWISSHLPSLKFEPIKTNCDVVVSLWCMFPSVSFTDAFNECQSVILASGTLCPTETLKSELGLSFNSEMEGAQVIRKEQIFATVLSAGPSGTRLNATYKNIASGSEFMVELARVIVSTCLTVPKGVLCFVSSYNVLNLLKECIDQQGLNVALQSRKVIFEEPRRSADLQSTLDSYDDVIKNSKRYGPDCDGALMLAVFRGKVSEGIDFADDKARCVICVGIPYPNARNELVVQKKRFNDENAKSAKILTGDEWYTTQAYRALNQALGRCLRHKGDWGALVLVDERFEAKANPRCSDSKKLSRWVRDRLVIYSDFVKFETALSKFVDKMSEENFIKNQPRLYEKEFKTEVKPIIDIF